MIRRALRVVVLAGLVAFALAGCAFAPLSILGTWIHASGLESIEFTLNKFIVTDLSASGTWECEIDKVESSNDRLRMTTTVVYGSLAGISFVGQEIYLLWDVSGDTMLIGLSDISYPTSATIGPYYKD